MRRHFSEVRHETGLEEQRMKDRLNKDNYGYKKIKPETDITVEEAQAFWDNLFEGMGKENAE